MEYERYKILYKTDIYGLDEKKLIILNEGFVKRNKNKFKLIINNKKYLKYILNAEKIIKKSNLIKVELIIYKNIVDISYMFKNCRALLEISDVNDKEKNEYIEISELNNEERIREIAESKILMYDDIDDIEEEHPIYKSFYSNYNNYSNTKLSTIKENSFYISDSKSLKDINDVIQSNLEVEKPLYIERIFSNCPYLLYFPYNSKMKYKVVNEMNYAFYNCQSLTILPDLSNLNTENVTSMNFIFANCISLTSLPGISTWNTKNVRSMHGMFNCCSKLSLDSIPDIGKWDTSNVTDMS